MTGNKILKQLTTDRIKKELEAITYSFAVNPANFVQ